jgi:hypothetical protein
MDVSRFEDRIDAIDWYHEFDFGKVPLKWAFIVYRL